MITSEQARHEQVASKYPARVICSANRGHQYRVTFDAVGAVISVESKVHGPEAVTWRVLWRHDSGKTMGITAACAIRAARFKLEPPPSWGKEIPL